MPHPLFPDDEFPVAALPDWPEDDHTGDGYDWAQELPTGWDAVYSWGSEGWDLGSLPYQVVAHYDCPLDVIYGMAHYIEGDVKVRAFGSREARDAATDELALSIWLAVRNGPRQGLPAADTPAADIPARFRGPYRPNAEHTQ
uniref:Uncharacterized protein n=1 Tax=Streptomyces sp. FR1 TaxID=349971 RepID=V9Z5V6_9ACTN|nr:hypothetical protein [Streptomyces sp. FR1]AHE38781.1 Hypothetical protein pFRL3_4c [Streptomyces sp. FR1]